MSWGARSLARNAAMILLLKVLSPYAAATERSSTSGSMDTYTAVALADRGKRESNSMPDILIEHVEDEEGELPFFPLLVGLMVMGGLIILILLLLACHLLLRLAESKCSKYRYRRLHPDDPETGYRTTLPAKPSHVFTYVDLSYNECAHADHDEEENRAPRFGVNFNTAAKVDGSKGDLRREKRGTPIPAPRRSQPLRLGLPTGDKEEATDSAPVHQERAEEGAASSQKVATSTTENPDEPPKKKICSQHVACAHGSRSGGLNDEGEFNVFVERCTQFKSVAPEFEINVRDRMVRGRPHGGIVSPRRSGLAGVTEEVVPGMWAETNQAYYPGIINTQSRRYGRASDSSSNTPYNLYETASQSHSLDGINLSLPDDSTSQQTFAHEQHGTSMSGHGRYYEQHALEEKRNEAIVSGANHPVQPNIDSESKVQDRAAAVLAPSSHDGPHSTLVEVPDTEVSAYRSPSTSSLKSPRLPSTQEDEAYKARESAVSAQKSSETSNALGRPIHLDMTLVLPGVASPQTSAQGTPLEPRSSEMRVQVPQMIAYFDKPPTVQRFKAKLDGSSTECSVPNRPRHSSVPSEAMSTKDMLVSLPSPGKTVLVNETSKLPEPSPDQLYLKSPDEKCAVAVRALQSVRKRHDVQDTTEPFSVDEASQQRTSRSELLSATDMYYGRVGEANSRSRSSLVLAHSQPSMEISPVAHVERSVSTHSRPAVTGSISTLGTNDLVKERDQDLHAVEVIPSPSKQSVDAIPTSILPTNEELPYEAASHVQASQERTKAGAELVSPVDTPEYRALIPPESSLHLEEITPAGMPAQKSDGATIAVKEDGSVRHPAQREGTVGDTTLDAVEAHGRATEAGGTHPVAVVFKQDAVATREEIVPPAMISSGIDQASLVTKEPLEVNLSTEETDLEAQMETYTVKQRSPSEANAPYPSQNQATVPDRDNVVLSRIENEVPSHKADTSVLETELAGRLALVKHDDKPTELSATAPPHVLMQPAPLDTILSRADNEVASRRDEAGTGVVETKAAGKPISRDQQPPFPREGEEASLDSSDTKANSTVAEKRFLAEKPQLLYSNRRGEDLITVRDPVKPVLESRSPKKLFPVSTPRPPDIRSTPAHVIAHTPVSSAQDQKSTAVAIRREQKVPEEQHTGPFSDSNRQVSESSVPLKQVDARFPSNRHRRSLDDPSSFRQRDKLSEQLKSSSSLVESSESQPRHLSSMHSLRSSQEPSHLSKDDSTGTHSATTFLLNPDLPEGDDSARREIVPSGRPQSVSEVEPTSQTPHDKLPPHLPQSNVTALSIANQFAPPGSPRKGSIPLSQAQHSVPNPNLPKKRSGTELPEKNVLLDSSVVPPYRRRRASGGKPLPRPDSKPAGSLETLGSSSSKSLEVQSQRDSVTSVAPLEIKTDSFQAPVQIPHGEMSIGRNRGEVTSASHHPAVLTESKPTVEVSADQQKHLTPKRRDSRQVSLPSHPSGSELAVQPKVSTIQPTVASRKLLTSGGNELLSVPRDDTATSTHAVRRSEGFELSTFVPPHEEHHVLTHPVQPDTEISQREPSSVQLAGTPRTLETRDEDGLAIASSDNLDAAARQVTPLDSEISREPSAVQLAAPSGTLATSAKNGLPMAELDTSGTEISQLKPSSVQLAAAPRTLEKIDKDGLTVAPSHSLEAATRQVRPREGSESNSAVERQNEYHVPSDAEISRRQPSTVQPADVLRTLATSDKNGLPISLKDSSTAATREVGASEVSESNTSVQPHKDHHPVPSDAEISQRKPSAVQLAAAPRTLKTRDKDGLAIASSDGSAATRQVRPRKGSEPNTSVQPHKDYPVPSDAGTSREQSLVQQAAVPRMLVTSDRGGLPVALSDSSVASERAAIPSERLEQETSLAPHQMHSELSDAEGSRPLVAKERPPSADVFFGRTSPVQAHGSKDLIVLQADPNNDASSLQEKRADEEHTDIAKPPASNDKTEQSKK